MIDITSIRAQFPILTRKVNGKPLIYFDNAATGQKPQCVIDAISQYYQKTNSNVHRGVHTLSMEATNELELTRSKLQKHFNARFSHEIVFTRGTTESINLVANGFAQLLQSGDEILISYLEHHSNIVPWQMACEKSGATLKVIPINQKGELDMESFEQLLSHKTKIVAVNHVSNALGTINPIREIIVKAHRFGSAVLIDGAQATAHIAINVQELDCDFYCVSAHKMYGPTGIGMLYGKEEWLTKLPPYQGGGEMIKEVTFEKTTFADLPFKFEAGTPNIADGIAFGTTIDFINSIGLENMAHYEQELLEYATQKLESIPQVKLVGTATHKAAVISFVVDGIHPFDIGSIIDKLGVAVRTGHHCAQPLMQFYNIPGTIRVSFAVYNTKEEIDVFIHALEKAILMLS
jgi:cysteine desulfurase/selenocysteine lyase